MLEDIKKNIDRLIAMYEGEKQQRIRLGEELEKSNATVASYEKKISELERQVDNLKLTQAFTSGGDNASAKEKIEKLIKEIDKCISLLER